MNENGNQNGLDQDDLKNGITGPRGEELVYISPLNGEKSSIPDESIKCTWSKTAIKDGVFFPHTTQNRINPEKIAPDVLSLIGNTPMVKLNSIPKKAGIKCNIYVKLEYFNPGGSIKDRIAKRMIDDAEQQGVLKPGMTIIEPSSGNTGIGIAIACAIKGYKCMIVLTEKMSNEKVAVMKALGAELITPLPNERIFTAANRIHKETPNSLVLDQFLNPGNPLAHYDATAEEILDQCDHKVDVLVIGAGTGGTLTGISRKFKEVSPQTTVVAVDPEGSIFAIPAALNDTDVTSFEVEGLGAGFIPTSLDRTCVDVWVKTNDKESLTMARRLIREEGILCGSSSGAVVAAAIKVANDLQEGQNLVVVLPDSIRNYLTKFVSEQWMEEKGLQPCENVHNYWWWEESIDNLGRRKIDEILVNETCEDVLSFMRDQNRKEIAVMKLDGNILGTVTLKRLINSILSKDVLPNDRIEKCTTKTFPKIDVKSGNIGLVSRILEKDSYVIVIESSGVGHSKTEKPLGIIDITDLYQYIIKNEKKSTYQNGLL